LTVPVVSMIFKNIRRIMNRLRADTLCGWSCGGAEVLFVGKSFQNPKSLHRASLILAIIKSPPRDARFEESQALGERFIIRRGAKNVSRSRNQTRTKSRESSRLFAQTLYFIDHQERTRVQRR